MAQFTLNGSPIRREVPQASDLPRNLILFRERHQTTDKGESNQPAISRAAIQACDLGWSEETGDRTF